MAGIMAVPMRLLGFIEKHSRIIWALLMREMATRYGRDNIGFVWLIAEPMLFGSGVAILYSYIRGPYELGIPVLQFTLTGYMPMIMVRQGVNYSMASTRVNAALLYHRQIAPLHLFISRFAAEFCGVSLAYIFEVIITNALGMMPLPKDPLILITGWFLLAILALGLAMFMNAMAEMYEFVERIIPLLTYLFIPISGFMYMFESLPPPMRKLARYIPFPHCFEMMRSGYFGPYLHATYDAWYALAWGVGIVLLGLTMQQFVRSRVEVL